MMSSSSSVRRGGRLRDSGPPLAIGVSDLVASDPEQPRGHSLDRVQPAVGLDQLSEQVLQDILSIVLVPDPRPDKVEQATPLRPNRSLHREVLTGDRVAVRGIHLP